MVNQVKLWTLKRTTPKDTRVESGAGEQKLHKLRNECPRKCAEMAYPIVEGLAYRKTCEPSLPDCGRLLSLLPILVLVSFSSFSAIIFCGSDAHDTKIFRYYLFNNFFYTNNLLQGRFLKSGTGFRLDSREGGQ